MVRHSAPVPTQLSTEPIFFIVDFGLDYKYIIMEWCDKQIRLIIMRILIVILSCFNLGVVIVWLLIETLE